ncbi:2,3-bisphosphoglycerate-independent phosphoglycerate mutase [hydrothermal vent metagenome]|uniref:2,3-bisphosphoglycerate-independent phosphoglycerate mutase n=1 Tax=hydrothermal vent metagenome TaxID=652676 RepID=A0A3B0ZJD8_9ZZZZ
MSNYAKPMLLVIFDGWGYSEKTENNAIAIANKPNWDRLWDKYPHAFINGSGASVGLPADQMGNSEVGHLNLGAGRVVYQEFTRVSRSIKTGSFFNNQTLVDAVEVAANKDKAVHILGLLSAGGVHSHEDHIHAMVELAVQRGAKKIYVHAFLDGRDTAPKSALKSIKKMDAKFAELGVGRIASIIGRYFAMDRDNRWPRVQKAYDLMTHGVADFESESALAGLGQAYNRDETDEFIQATVVVPPGDKAVRIEDGDSVIFMNYRSDRARQITRPYIEPDFNDFDRGIVPKIATFASLTEYKSDFDVPVAYPPDRLKQVFGEYISGLGLNQLRIAETEKYAHVTFFFNGGREEPFEFEDRILIKSPDVPTYDLQPEMCAPELTDKLIAAIESGKYDVIICNYANPDMVGHTGNLKATVKAIEALDECLGRLVKVIEKCDGEMLLTADHGNAEMMVNPETGEMHTAHTTNVVPLIYVGQSHELVNQGVLSDIAPTMLNLMGLDQPIEMSGCSLVKLAEPAED